MKIDEDQPCDLRLLHQRGRGAFTLVELLVVLALLLVLMALLMPYLREGLERANEVTCRSNLRQIAAGAFVYAADRGHLPPSHIHGYAVWPALVRSYLSPNTDVFYCPSADPALATRWIPRFGSGLPAEWGYEADEVRLRTGGKGSYPFGYGHNNGGTRDHSFPPLGMGDPWPGIRGLTLVSRMVSPPNFMMFGDSLVNGVWDHFIDEDVPGEEPAVRHRGGAFIVFGDGHVEHIIPGPYLDLGNTGANDPNLRRRWNVDNQPH